MLEFSLIIKHCLQEIHTLVNCYLLGANLIQCEVVPLHGISGRRYGHIRTTFGFSAFRQLRVNRLKVESLRVDCLNESLSREWPKQIAEGTPPKQIVES